MERTAFVHENLANHFPRHLVIANRRQSEVEASCCFTDIILIEQGNWHGLLTGNWHGPKNLKIAWHLNKDTNSNPCSRNWIGTTSEMVSWTGENGRKRGMMTMMEMSCQGEIAAPVHTGQGDPTVTD